MMYNDGGWRHTHFHVFFCINIQLIFSKLISLTYWHYMGPDRHTYRHLTLAFVIWWHWFSIFIFKIKILILTLEQLKFWQYLFWNFYIFFFTCETQPLSIRALFTCNGQALLQVIKVIHEYESICAYIIETYDSNLPSKVHKGWE